MVEETDAEDDDEDVLVQDVEDEDGDDQDDDEAEADCTCDVNEQDVETDSDNMSVDTEVAECHFTTIKEAFMAGWKAQQKTNAKRKARGLLTLPRRQVGVRRSSLRRKLLRKNLLQLIRVHCGNRSRQARITAR